jgi:hypothetical protein
MPKPICPYHKKPYDEETEQEAQEDIDQQYEDQVRDEGY